jgi:drug/metabolite transporter (DMT)-like permease
MTLASQTGTAPIPRRAIVSGIVYMCAAGTILPIMNGLVQILSARYPSEQIVWARATAHLVFALALFAPRHGLVRLLSTVELKWQLARSVALLLSTLCFFTGVKYLPLAKAAAISFTAPFLVAILAWAILGERLSLQRLAAVLVGFVGVLVVIRPGSDVFQWASLLIISSAITYAFYQVFTRRVAGRDSPETSAVYSALVSTVVMSCIAPWSWITPLSWTDVALLAALGVLGGLGHYCIARALTYAPASVVSPFQYWQLFGSVSVGYLFMGHLPDSATWLGAAIIVSAGLYIGLRETRERSVA